MMSKISSPPRGRQQKQSATNKKLSKSSRAWVQRQLNDPYVAEAQKLGYRSRAAFKIIQLDEKCGLFRPGMTVVDLGAAPGGWSQIAAAKKCKVIAMDLLEIQPLSGVEFIQGDFSEEEVQKKLLEMIGGRKVDLVMSDIAPNTTGHHDTDHMRIMALAEEGFYFAQEVLAEGGAFVCKLFQGGASGDLLQPLKQSFAKVRHIKPPASRKDSSELYLVATGFRSGPI
ncbi:MAG TPA: RlmE family RNA methyltransferase [Alphaproteobacteria bacterium]|nr:rRNA methyltransferase [Rhodospirillaceae bacterium]HRJ12287.1 RlmE family RNA methyltransferase [Alphaproteobacteria bacterium]